MVRVCTLTLGLTHCVGVFFVTCDLRVTSQESRMTLPLESTRVIIVAGVHFQVISAGNTPEIVTICGMVDTLSIDACQISNPLLKHFIKSR